MPRILGAPSDQAQQIQSEDKDPFQVISDEDLYKADEEMSKEILHYAGYTALTVIFFLILVESANNLVPGILVAEDGTIETYEPSPDEMDALFELINEFMTFS